MKKLYELVRGNIRKNPNRIETTSATAILVVAKMATMPSISNFKCTTTYYPILNQTAVTLIFQHRGQYKSLIIFAKDDPNIVPPCRTV